MAFLKKEKLPNGVEVEYWKLVQVQNLNFLTKEAEAVFSGYLSEEARQANVKAPVTRKVVTVKLESFDGDIRDLIYAAAPEAQDRYAVRLPKPGEEPKKAFFFGAENV